MSPYATIKAKRTKAIGSIVNFALQANNEDLGDMMDVVLRKSLYNCIVVDDDADIEEEYLVY